MALITLSQLLDHAAENGYGMPAFNVNNMEQVQAIMQAADETDSPVIMQGSAGARNYAGEPFLRHLIEAAVEMYPHIPVVHASGPRRRARRVPALHPVGLHLRDDGRLADGGRQDALQLRLQRRRHPQRGATWRMRCGVSVEGELGCLGSLETGMAGEEDGHGAEGKLDHDQLLTDPEEAADFVDQDRRRRAGHRHRHQPRRLQVHPARRPATSWRIERIKEIHARIPNTHLVMHGSSSVPQDWLKIINQFGGDMGETYGVPVEEIQEGIKHGVRKINIDTDLRMASTGADPQVPGRESEELRPAQVPQGGHHGHEGHLQGALRSLRLRRHGRQDQADEPRGDGQALRLRRTRPADQGCRGQGWLIAHLFELRY